jgi:NDP-sugar pyrophosphorylase family protein
MSYYGSLVNDGNLQYTSTYLNILGDIIRNLHTVIPMAGNGSRFVEADITTPKPLILVDGRPMFTHALDGLDSTGADLRHSFVIRQAHDIQYNLGALIRKELLSASIIATDEKPKGSLVGAYRAWEFMGEDDGIFLTYCDVRTTNDKYFKTIRENLLGTLLLMVHYYFSVPIVHAADMPN